MRYELEWTTKEAEKLIEHVKAIKEHAKAFEEYCTDECVECPLRGFCDWDRNIDFFDEGIESMERLVDFVNYPDKVDEKREREEERTWEAANRWAGIDPSWASLPRAGRI